MDLDNPIRCHIVVGLDASKKTISIDGKNLTSKSKYALLGGSVSFSPDDLLLVKGAPDARRHFLDQFGWGIDPSFVKIIQRFEHVLKQRNKLLKMIKEGSFSLDEYSLWTEKFVESAIPVYEFRFELLKKINSILSSIHQKLFNVRETIQMIYEFSLPETDSLENSLWLKINQMREAERAVGHSLVGPHRDDFSILINGMKAKQFGSQGQLRAVTISLKLAQLELTKSHRSWSPILLLDDIISELDESRTEALINYLSSYSGQIFLTTAEISKIRVFREKFVGLKVIDLDQPISEMGELSESRIMI